MIGPGSVNWKVSRVPDGACSYSCLRSLSPSGCSGYSTVSLTSGQCDARPVVTGDAL